ncbi:MULTISPECIES: hypothetical protein [Pectobacterium]|uniref:hypothetical protein n=1 Tax=Pectobacterium TaxID=122277 RepID=UPI00193D6294|nr:hypothetical protein [Pectobacterium brasiliense]QRN32600.1 hypothetical protein IHJ54_11315 [Pectobacterium brasiliense]
MKPNVTITEQVEKVLEKNTSNANESKNLHDNQNVMIRELRESGVLKKPSYELACGPTVLQHRFSH